MPRRAHVVHRRFTHKEILQMTETRLEKLKELENELYKQLKVADARSVAAISKQYRETIKEIEEIEGGGNAETELDRILEE